MAPRETENNAYAKLWGDKQRAFWYVMVFSGVVNCGQPKEPSNPNLQVAFMHVWYACTQLSFELAQGMNGMHRMQSDMHV